MIRLLQTENSADERSFAFDWNDAVIKFSDSGSAREYGFQVQTYSGFSVLRPEQTATIGTQSHVPFKRNPFLVRKLQAEIVPYSQYGF